ncbi:hypothetical protein BGZ59_008537 [Podila verticillata]|nr:hypothetical protein BGZ59_008537 [Podila verticillata]KAI9241226.1 MAG: hypothetical protein BYD32DRAFT_406237 [Podila humilis]KFH72898.1 hypothetical protein MVEG_00123 [Podila verticillata NRRL 6337]
MSFSSQGWYLKTDFLMSSILALLGLIVLGIMSKKSYFDYGGIGTVCILAGAGVQGFYNHAACVWSAVAGFLVAAGGVGLFAMDFVTWKRSEHFKGKRASVAALLISPAGAFISFATAIIIGVGLKNFCKDYTSQMHINDCQTTVPELNSLYTGVTCATLAGFLFVFYAFSEYAQYRRRHVQGDKW